MIEWIRFILGSALILFGLFFEISALIGNFRFKFALNRMHSAALGDTMGLFGIMAGLCLYNGLNVATLKFILVVLLFWLTSPVTSHLLMLMEISNGRYTAEVNEEHTDEEGFESFALHSHRSALDEGDNKAKEDDKK